MGSAGDVLGAVVRVGGGEWAAASGTRWHGDGGIGS